MGGFRSARSKSASSACLFTGQLVSLLGGAVTPFALAWAVLDLTGSARDLGYVIAANTAPLVIFLLVGGVFADRLPRRGVMLTADVARMAVQAATAALLLSHTARIWELIVLQALAGTGTAFFNPASTGLTPMTVSAGRLQEAEPARDVDGVDPVRLPGACGHPHRHRRAGIRACH